MTTSLGIHHHGPPGSGLCEIHLVFGHAHAFRAPPVQQVLGAGDESKHRFRVAGEFAFKSQIGHLRFVSFMRAASSRLRLASQNSRWLIVQALIACTASGRTE